MPSGTVESLGNSSFILKVLTYFVIMRSSGCGDSPIVAKIHRIEAIQLAYYFSTLRPLPQQVMVGARQADNSFSFAYILAQLQQCHIHFI